MYNFTDNIIHFVRDILKRVDYISSDGAHFYEILYFAFKSVVFKITFNLVPITPGTVCIRKIIRYDTTDSM